MRFSATLPRSGPRALLAHSRHIRLHRCANIVRVDSAILRQATYGTARIGLHTAFSEQLKERNGGNAIPFYQKFTSSFLSGAIASSIGNPFDVAVSVPAPPECMALDCGLPIDVRRRAS